MDQSSHPFPLDEPPIPQTLPILPKDRKITFQSLLGNAYFREKMSLILTIDQVNDPLIFCPPPLTVLGRTNQSPAEVSVINLSPYDARAKGVSRLHAFLRRTQHTLAIEDMGSSNGTFVNGYRLKAHEPHVLHDHDEVTLGLLNLRVTFQ
jgi:FHA domain-containing protein